MKAMAFNYFSIEAGETVTAQTSDHSCPSDLITKRETIPVNEQFRKYQPRKWPEDLIWMFLTGAAVVRFANTFLDAFKKNFVLFAIYVWEKGKVTRYTLFQGPKKPAVRYKTLTYWLNAPVGRAKFVGQLYNLPYAGKGRGSRRYEREGYRIKREDRATWQDIPYDEGQSGGQQFYWDQEETS
ncbi:hypothetical protein BC827DRAFT_629998 [Russula dissimulans]|nr:hypothetical protein BC827DRAFT_629998 [Russula dissimulans]